MLNRLISWALHSRLIVLLMAIGLGAFGGYAFTHVNVEAYPDPAPAIIEVIAQFPGASAEEVERQVTIPLEVTLAGMPELKVTRSKSLAGLAHLRCQFEYSLPYKEARQEVINRLQFTEALPPGVAPTLSPQSPTGEIFRYTLRNPVDEGGRPIYSLSDLKALQDWTLERTFKRVPRIIDVVGSGGTVKRYEVQPDPARMARYGITLGQLSNAISSSNTNVGAGSLRGGDYLANVRSVALFGRGLDPMTAREVFAAHSPADAADSVRVAEAQRVREIRRVVVAATNNLPVRVEDLVDGGPARGSDDADQRGVIVGFQPRLGRVGLTEPRRAADGTPLRTADGRIVWRDEDDKVQGIILLRKNEDTLPALHDVEAKVKELNEGGGRLLPGVKVEPYYNRSDLISVTTDTVQENMVLGMTLVTLILFMFLSNIRSAVIVAINIPLALMFAFAVLFLRGRSANLLSIGAVDFGIIVDSSVIMVENIYRHLASGERADYDIRERIRIATREVQKGLLFSTLIMVCAFLPLFTMKGPEGQIFGPMADTYAFALAGALILAVTVAPVLCSLLFRNLRQAEDNLLVRRLRANYLHRLDWCMRNRWLTLGFMSLLLAGTVAMLPNLGREFMPELEEGNLWIRGTFPVNVSLEASAEQARQARRVMSEFEEVQLIVSQTGRPDDGTDPTGPYNTEYFLPLRPMREWPQVKDEVGWRAKLFGDRRARAKAELVREMKERLVREIPGVDWNFSQNIRDNVMESLSGVKGDNSLKIFGPDLHELERLANESARRLQSVPGIEDVGVFRIMGQPTLELPVDQEKCNRWGVQAQDVQSVLEAAVGGKAFSQMVEGEKKYDITLRYPLRLRDSEGAILKIPVDLGNNQVAQSAVPQIPSTKFTGQATGLSTLGTSAAMPALTGSVFGGTVNYMAATPRRPVEDFVTPPQSPDGSSVGFMRPGASTIYREQGQRMIAVKFSVRGRDLAGAVAEAREKTGELFQTPYSAVWSGEFEEMEEAEARLMLIIPVSLVMIFVLLYMAFGSLIDALLVLSNVVAMSMGGVWALLLTGTNFSISAAVGFISIFGVAIMDGLLSVAYFAQHRAQGMDMREAILQGAGKRVRPMMMTSLTAVFGLLPAAFSTRIGAQTQRPLAIVVVGGMIMALLLNRYLMPVLYSLCGNRAVSEEAAHMAH